MAYIHRRRPRRSRPEQGFPSKDLIGVRAERIRAIMGLMASSQWGGRLTEIALAREWNLSLDYVKELASDASAQIQLSVTTDFQATLRARLFASAEALTAKMAEVVMDDSRHGSYDRYEISEDGVRWYEVPRKEALSPEVRDAYKVRRIPCTPVASLPSFVQTAIRGHEAMARLAGVQMDPLPERDGEAARPGERPGITLNVHYQGVAAPEPEGGDGPPPAAPAQPAGS